MTCFGVEGAGLAKPLAILFINPLLTEPRDWLPTR